MENPTLPTNWLAALSNANHDGTTQQIDDAVGNFETENQVFLQSVPYAEVPICSFSMYVPDLCLSNSLYAFWHSLRMKYLFQTPKDSSSLHLMTMMKYR